MARFRRRSISNAGAAMLSLTSQSRVVEVVAVDRDDVAVWGCNAEKVNAPDC